MQFYTVEYEPVFNDAYEPIGTSVHKYRTVSAALDHHVRVLTAALKGNRIKWFKITAVESGIKYK